GRDVGEIPPARQRSVCADGCGEGEQSGPLRSHASPRGCAAHPVSALILRNIAPMSGIPDIGTYCDKSATPDLHAMRLEGWERPRASRRGLRPLLSMRPIDSGTRCNEWSEARREISEA